MTLAYRIIRSEHYEINLVMRCLDNLVDAVHREIWEPDFDLLFLILHYVESFPGTKRAPGIIAAIRRPSLNGTIPSSRQ